MFAGPPHPKASRLSALVRPLLATGRPAKVLAVFRQAAYLSAGSDVIALVDLDLGPGPLSIEIPQPLDFQSWLVAGQEVVVVPQQLISAGGTVDLSTAVEWDPYPPWDVVRARLPLDRLADLRRWGEAYAPAGSLMELLSSDPKGDQVPSMAAAIRAAREPVGHLLRTLRSAAVGGEEAQAVGPAAAPLAGLGGGFTPAGDDFLTGLIFATWAMLPEARAAAFAQAVSEAAAPLTSTVSGAYLRAASLRAAGEAWHDLLHRLSEHNRSGLEPAVVRLCRIGHTSGADALAGFLLGVEALRDPG